jgi:hypothetical protein
MRFYFYALGIAALLHMPLGFAQGCPFSGMNRDPNPDPPSRLFPGKYFQYKAQFYFKKGEISAATSMYEHAAYWGNKDAEYNLGMIYWLGADKQPADHIRAAAWFGIAAESHRELADRALKQIWDSLNEEQRRQANDVWADLDKKYGDKVTLPRMMRRYEDERQNVTGSHVGFVGNVTVCLPDGTSVDGATYYAEMDKEYAEYVESLSGHVDVGPIEPTNRRADETQHKNPEETKP